MLEDVQSSIQPFHRPRSTLPAKATNLVTLDARLGLSVMDKSLPSPYALLKQYAANGAVMTRIIRSLLLPFFKSSIVQKNEAYITIAVQYHYIKKIVKQYSTPDFQIGVLTSMDCDMLKNEHHQESIALRKQLREAKLIIWPIVYNEHSHLIFFKRDDLDKLEVGILDSGNSTVLNRYLVSKTKPILKYLQSPFSGSQINHYLVPFQSTQYDCGAACTYFAKALCLKVDLNSYSDIVEAVDYSQFRLTLASNFSDYDINALHHGIYISVE